ncbi:MAG: HTH-type transcriptional activator mta [Firmicutes bacterium ADurb.Bin193]|nr:MAG: HTH-type transcriptional activator mta [Firmicutes bacterium ADurb.Bin193]
MEYTIKKLGQMAGISTRTLRYYDETGLLKPARINTSGYRIYGAREVDTLQQIMFYRELGVGLSTIKEIISSPDFDSVAALEAHRRELIGRRETLDTLIANVEKTISAKRGGKTMNDREKFEGFKQKLIDDNNKKYGKEIREKYGAEAVKASEKKLKSLTPEQYERLSALEKEVLKTLKTAMEEGDPSDETAQKAADLHRQWLSFYWDGYTKEAHAGLAQMYVSDERFAAYYNRVGPGAAEFLRDAILIYTK